jgi:arsenate reductase
MGNRLPIRLPFVCTGNSARSQMAEEFARAYAGDWCEVQSAGIDPKGLNPFAVEIMREREIDISAQSSNAFSEALARTMDYVITLCGHAEERCAGLPPEVDRLHWPLEDPARAEGTPDQVRLEASERDAIDPMGVRAPLADPEPGGPEERLVAQPVEWQGAAGARGGSALPTGRRPRASAAASDQPTPRARSPGARVVPTNQRRTFARVTVR